MPAADEIYYDDIDQNCDGLSDYDADGDGYDAMEYEDADGTTIIYGGDDCDDSDDELHPADMEIDPEQCYLDADGDGYGDMDLTESEAFADGIVAGTDCFDSSWSTYAAYTYAGAGYNEIGDLATACVEDKDGDGYGDIYPSTFYNIVLEPTVMMTTKLLTHHLILMVMVCIIALTVMMTMPAILVNNLKPMKIWMAMDMVLKPF